MASSATAIEKLPSVSVTVPFCVPLSRTFTPGIADPSSREVTLPETFLAKVNAITSSTAISWRSLSCT